MAKPGPHVQPKMPVKLLNKPVSIDLKEIFTSCSKICAQVWLGKPVEAITSTSQVLGSISLKSDSGELAYELIRRSLIKAIADVTTESARHIDARSSYTENDILNELDYPFVLHNGSLRDVEKIRVSRKEVPLRHFREAVNAASRATKLQEQKESREMKFDDVIRR